MLKIILPHPTVLYILKGAVASNTLVESRECKYIPGELTQNTVINTSKLYVRMIIYVQGVKFNSLKFVFWILLIVPIYNQNINEEILNSMRQTSYESSLSI